MDPNQLTTEELQEIVLMTKSKKGLGTYLNMEQKDLNILWKKHLLKAPTEYVRGMTYEMLLQKLKEWGSLGHLARHYGVSPATIGKILGRPEREDLTKEQLIDLLRRYKSIRLTTRMFNLKTTGLRYKESEIRKKAEEHQIDLSELLDWTFTGHPSGKGRRAELDFAKMRGERILEDCNKTQGSQATTDYVDSELGRVNVKSSARYKYKAQTRKDAPHYWKFSLSSIDHSDVVACMAYDDSMRKLMGYALFKAASLAGKYGTSGTITLGESHLTKIGV